MHRLASVVLLWIAPLYAIAQAQEDVHAKMRKSLAYIEASATPNNGGEILRGRGTGFIVGEEGYILTTQELFRPLVGSRDGSLKTRVALFGDPAPNRDAIVVYASPAVDLVLLKIASESAPFPPVELGNSRLYAEQRETQVLISGFFIAENNSPRYRSYNDVVETFDDPASLRWLLKAHLNSGQSGSPVYITNGIVVGILAGEPSVGRAGMIPIELADILIAGIRFRQMKRQIDELQLTAQGLKDALNKSRNLRVTTHFFYTGEYDVSDGKGQRYDPRDAPDPNKIAERICPKATRQLTRYAVRGGNCCGYAFYLLTCSEPS